MGKKAVFFFVEEHWLRDFDDFRRKLGIACEIYEAGLPLWAIGLANQDLTKLRATPQKPTSVRNGTEIIAENLIEALKGDYPCAKKFTKGHALGTIRFETTDDFNKWWQDKLIRAERERLAESLQSQLDQAKREAIYPGLTNDKLPANQIRTPPSAPSMPETEATPAPYSAHADSTERTQSKRGGISHYHTTDLADFTLNPLPGHNRATDGRGPLEVNFDFRNLPVITDDEYELRANSVNMRLNISAGSISAEDRKSSSDNFGNKLQIQRTGSRLKPHEVGLRIEDPTPLKELLGIFYDLQVCEISNYDNAQIDAVMTVAASQIHVWHNGAWLGQSTDSNVSLAEKVVAQWAILSALDKPPEGNSFYVIKQDTIKAKCND